MIRTYKLNPNYIENLDGIHRVRKTRERDPDGQYNSEIPEIRKLDSSDFEHDGMFRKTQHPLQPR